MTERVGVFIPTYNRPDLLRACVLQWAVQTRSPDHIVIHQNGSAESYEWCINDIRDLVPCTWIHSPEALKPVEWYRRPLKYLLDDGCSHFFWADHDDLYLRNHIETRLTELDTNDFTIANRTSLLFQTSDVYKFQPVVNFISHPAGGMSSSMAFTRAFAEVLHQDFLDNSELYYADDVVGIVTKPKFESLISQQLTTIYVSHPGSTTSDKWLDDALKDVVAGRREN